VHSELAQENIHSGVENHKRFQWDTRENLLCNTLPGFTRLEIAKSDLDGSHISNEASMRGQHLVGHRLAKRSEHPDLGTDERLGEGVLLTVGPFSKLWLRWSGVCFGLGWVSDWFVLVWFQIGFVWFEDGSDWFLGAQAPPRTKLNRLRTKNTNPKPPKNNLKPNPVQSFRAGNPAFRAGFWPDCYRETTEIGPPSGRRPAGGPISVVSRLQSGQRPPQKSVVNTSKKHPRALWFARATDKSTQRMTPKGPG
jgi:hypothetical protein